MDNKEITKEISDKYVDFIESIESEYNVKFEIMTSLNFTGISDPAIKGGCVIANIGTSEFIEKSIKAFSKYPPFFKEMTLLVLKNMYNATLETDPMEFGGMPSTEELGDLLNDLNDN